MSSPSQWPLPKEGVRILTPSFMKAHLAANPISADLFPTAMGYYPLARGHQMEREKHDDYLLIYCVEGAGWLETPSGEARIQPGDIIVLPTPLSHRYGSDANNPWTIYWVHYEGDKALNYTEHVSQQASQYVFNMAGTSGFRSAFNSLLEVARTGYESSAYLTVANRLKLLLVELGRARERDEARRGFDIDHIQELMRSRLRGQLSLDEMAQAAFLSKFHFSKRYKALTGYPPIQHFLNMKMEYACELLDGSALSVKAIAWELGFKDPLYFSRLFKRIIGSSPLIYRQSVKG